MIIMNKPRRNKFGAKKTTVGDNTFDSKMEAQYHQVLLNLQRAGEITDLRLQPKYLLQDKFNKFGKNYQAIYYIADFEYRDKSGRLIAVDVKGAETKEFVLKRKMFDSKYPDIELKVLTLHHGRWVLISEKKKAERDHKSAVKKLEKRAGKQTKGTEVPA